MYACDEEKFGNQMADESAKYFVKTFYYSGCDAAFDINLETRFADNNENKQDDEKEEAIENYTALGLALKSNNLAMAQAIVEEYGAKCNIGRVLYRCGKRNDYKSISWLINHKSLSKDIGNILSKGDSEFGTVLDGLILSKSSNTSSFAAMCLKILEIYDIDSWKTLMGEKRMGTIINDKILDKWQKDVNGNQSTRRFVSDLITNAWQVKSFTRFEMMLEDAAATILNNENNGSNKNVINKEVERLTGDFRNSKCQARYLFDNLEKSSLNDLHKVISNGIKKREIGFDDNLLILAKLVGGDSFVQDLQNITDQCLNNSKKTVATHTYFKNNLLPSNIWCMGIANQDQVQVEVDEHKQQIIFDQIESTVIAQELKSQQMFIQNALINEEKNNKEIWQQLKSIESINNSSKFRHEIDALYTLDELPSGNANGFDGSKEYDHNGYLTQLLIEAHSSGSVFQQRFNDFFKYENYGVACKFTPAPVKMKARCVVKAELDYKTRDWPHSQHIFDFLRCSVVFDTIDNLVKGVKSFCDKFPSEDIVRIKNGFSEIKDNIWNVDLKEIGYCDIKINVKVGKLISEVQFIPKFMLEAKKLGHSIYSFVRKGDLFHSIYNQNQLWINDNKFAKKSIKRMIATKNMTQFSKHLESLTQSEKNHVIKMQPFWMELMQELNWKKGSKLLKIRITSWTQ